MQYIVNKNRPILHVKKAGVNSYARCLINNCDSEKENDITITIFSQLFYLYYEWSGNYFELLQWGVMFTKQTLSSNIILVNRLLKLLRI